MLTLLTGGARSGKSSTAVRLAAAADAPVHYVATAWAGDDEMADRITRHRADRPSEWTTVEETVHLDDALARIADGDTVIVDCLALWVTNRLEDPDEVVLAEAAAVAARATARHGSTYVVTNEVGSGIVPDNALARRFRDLLGSVNQVFSSASDHAYLCVAGRVLPLVVLEDLS